MKNFITVLIVAALSLQLTAQNKVQRLVLVEEFTSANCGPCAAQNPAFNAILDANPTKVVAIKYQTQIGSADPLYTQTSTIANARKSYYAISGVPYGIVDGVAIANDCNGYVGAPACLSQADVDAAYAVPSKFTITATHYLSEDFDSIYIHVLFTAIENYSGTNVKARIAVTENEIHFTTPPGSNGETVFHDVMRAMYPDASGVAMPNAWHAGDTATLVFARPLPSFIYNKAEVGVVAFLQDDGANKAVLQADYSEPIPMPIDAAINEISNISGVSCATTITPSFTLVNKGQTDLTKVTVRYKLDNATAVDYLWSGTLAPTASELVNLPTLNVSAGSHTFGVTVVGANDTTDMNPANDKKTINFGILNSTGVAIPVTETFASSTFPPSGWVNHDVDADNYGWSRKTGTGGFGQSTSCAKMDYYNSVTGNIDDLYTPTVDLTGQTQAFLNFNVAYAPYDATYYDRLQVQASTNCGQTWTTIWDKQGTTLATAPATTSIFTPTSSQWRAESINLSNYLGQAAVIFRFHAISGWGNSCYIDDVNISNSSDIAENEKENQIMIYPNPAQNVLNITNVPQSIITVSDITGRVVEIINNNEDFVSINLDNYSNGSYLINIKGKDFVINKKVVVNK